MPTAKNGFHILNRTPKKYVLKKYPFLNANLLEKFPLFTSVLIMVLFLRIRHLIIIY